MINRILGIALFTYSSFIFAKSSQDRFLCRATPVQGVDYFAATVGIELGLTEHSEVIAEAPTFARFGSTSFLASQGYEITSEKIGAIDKISIGPFKSFQGQTDRELSLFIYPEEKGQRSGRLVVRSYKGEAIGRGPSSPVVAYLNCAP